MKRFSSFSQSQSVSDIYSLAPKR